MLSYDRGPDSPAAELPEVVTTVTGGYQPGALTAVLVYGLVS